MTYVNGFGCHIQNELNASWRNFSRKHEIIGRIGGAFIVVPLDVLTETFKAPLQTIEFVGLAAINLFGECTLKKALLSAELAIYSGLIRTPVSLAMAPIKLAFQELAMFAKPKCINSIQEEKPTFINQFKELLESNYKYISPINEAKIGYHIHTTVSSMYTHLNTVSNKHGILGRIYAIPIVLTGETADAFQTPLRAIEHFGRACINLVATPFPSENEYSFKKSLYHAQHTVECLGQIPISIGMLPIKIIYQLGASLIHPSRVRPFYNLHTFDTYSKKTGIQLESAS